MDLAKGFIGLLLVLTLTGQFALAVILGLTLEGRMKFSKSWKDFLKRPMGPFETEGALIIIFLAVNILLTQVYIRL